MAVLKFKHDRAGDTGTLTFDLASDGTHGAIGPLGISPRIGFERGIIDAQGWAKKQDGTDYPINEAEFDGATYRLTVKKSGTPMSSVTFVPVAENDVVDVNLLMRSGRGQAASPEQLRALSELLSETNKATTDLTAEREKVAQALAATAQQQAANNQQTAQAVADARAAANLSGLRVTPSGATEIDGSPVVYGIGDDSNHLGQAVTEDGTTHMHRASVGGVVTEPGYARAYSMQDADGREAFWVEQDGTFRAAKPGPEFGQQEPPPPLPIVRWGDSMTEYEGGAAYLGKLIGREIINLGISGQTSTEIVARAGAPGFLSVFGVKAPVNGVYPLTYAGLDAIKLHTSGLSDRGALLRAGLHTQHGRFGQTKGVLKWDLDADSLGSAATMQGRYSFSPDAGQIPLDVTGGPLTWIPDNPYIKNPSILWVGRNDVLKIGDAVADRVAAFIKLLGHENYIIMGVLNAVNETHGTAELAKILSCNRAIAQVAGRHYFDTRSVYCRNDDSTWTADGAPRAEYLSDGLHHNAAGMQLLAAALAQFNTERGFL